MKYFWFDFRRGLGIFLFTTASRKALGSTQPPIQWVTGALSLGVKLPGRKCDHSLPTSAEDMNACSSVKKKHRKNFNLLYSTLLYFTLLYFTLLYFTFGYKPVRRMLKAAVHLPYIQAV